MKYLRRMKRALLDGRAWTLESDTYLVDPSYDGGIRRIVGIFRSKRAAEWYRDHAVPPVSDGIVSEWIVSH